ncbi:hypothetical protein [Mycoplasma phocoenae]|uniref:Uncharacterized protein n=1 Tax=Mycoplasma phocoenae TaxID=754517 RepID=A0A858U534_9MOLU|nr:hypothetical protein [Mycoplasma phocoenae]QJG67179.1 hypothetical protein HGG69_02600 [Mycoplasma phocoenae]
MQKIKLVRYFLSETFDENKQISFNLKRVNEKQIINFKHLWEGIEKFNKLGNKDIDNGYKAKVWFHKNRTFRGSASPKACEIIIKRLKEEKIKEIDAIEFINNENLVEKNISKSKNNEDSKKDGLITSQKK